MPPLHLRRLATVLLGTLCTTSFAAANPTGPSPATVEKARLALEANDSKAAMALLSPPPLSGPATCVLGRALVKEGQRVRALLYLQRCHQFEANPEIRVEMASLRKDLRKGKRAPVSLAFSPKTAIAHIGAAYVDDTLLADDEIWLVKGSYRLEVLADGYEGGAFAIEVESSDRMLVPIRLQQVKGATTEEIDLGEDAGAELGQVQTTADPRPKKFKSLLAKRYRRAPTPTPLPEERDQPKGFSKWPLVSAAAGLGAVAGGVLLQSKDRDGAALGSYGTGAALGALAVYLLLRSDGESDSESTAYPASVSVTSDGAIFGMSSEW